MDIPAASAADHLCILVHGLWGNPNHLSYLRQTLRAQHPEDRLHILVAKSNADSFTYDGVEVGGERIADEIEQTIRELEQNGTKIRKISIIGYSLGGLVSRYAIGLLYKNGLFDTVKPINFTTFATPHLGIRTPKLGYRAYLWNVIGSRTLSTSGQQMFLIDSFRDTGRPLLALLANPNSIFVKGLRLFKNKSLYANTINDRSVPYYTSGISRTDPFVDVDKVDLHYLPGQEDPVVLDPSRPVSPRPAEKKQLSAYERFAPSPRTMNTLPFYALLFSLMPIVFPTYLVNSVYQSYKSAQRVRLHEAGLAGISLGRYRIPLLEEAQAAQDRLYERLADQQGEDYLPTPPPELSRPSRSSSPSSSTSASAAASGLSEDKHRQALSRREADREPSHFPLLALTEDQFDMIDNLDQLGWDKYTVHIQRHRHTHAAIIVRMEKPGFDEGRVVVKHWVEKFEI